MAKYILESLGGALGVPIAQSLQQRDLNLQNFYPQNILIVMKCSCKAGFHFSEW